MNQAGRLSHISRNMFFSRLMTFYPAPGPLLVMWHHTMDVVCNVKLKKPVAV